MQTPVIAAKKIGLLISGVLTDYQKAFQCYAASVFARQFLSYDQVHCQTCHKGEEDDKHPVPENLTMLQLKIIPEIDLFPIQYFHNCL